MIIKHISIKQKSWIIELIYCSKVSIFKKAILKFYIIFYLEIFSFFELNGKMNFKKVKCSRMHRNVFFFFFFGILNIFSKKTIIIMRKKNSTMQKVLILKFNSKKKNKEWYKIIMNVKKYKLFINVFLIAY